MLSKKDYKAIAEIIAEITDESVFTTTEDFNATLVARLSDYFAEDNPNFNRHKFQVACGF